MWNDFQNKPDNAAWVLSSAGRRFFLLGLFNKLQSLHTSKQFMMGSIL